MKYIYEIMGFAVLVWPLTLLVLIGLGAIVAGLLSAFIAKKTGRSGGKWFLIIIGTVIVFVFWDWPLTVMAHKYYCEKEAGFWVYKTLEQWKAENPGVYETLIDFDTNPYPDFSSWPQENWKGQTAYGLNKRFLIMYKHHIDTKDEKELFVNIWRWQTEIIDKSNDQTIAKFVNFSSGNGYIGGESPFKFWLQSNTCPNVKEDRLNLNKLINDFKGVTK